MISKSKVYRRACIGWFHTLVSLFVMAVSMTLIFAICVRFGGGKIIMSVLGTTMALALTMFFLSELVAVLVLRAERAEIDIGYPNFNRSVDELCRERGIRFKPRLYILNGFDKPNAAAFGMAILGQCGIGITPSIYELLTYEELKSVLAHELAHIRSKDVGLMTVIMVITSSAEQLSKKLCQGKIAKGPMMILLGWIIHGLAKLIFPIGRAAISQQREFTADALASLYVNTNVHLSSALTKLGKGAHLEDDEKSVFDDLMISHPRMEHRIQQLKSYQV